MQRTKLIPQRRFPAHGWVGLVLIGVFWPLNWGLSRTMPISSWGFFPLWVGYCLSVDAFNVYRSGTSLITRSPKKFLSLFLISAPVWWLFEVLNWRVQNWHYLGRELFTDLEYAFLGSLSFSTVIPAVFGTSEMFARMGFLQRFRNGPTFRPTRKISIALALVGLSMFLLMIAWPRLFFPFLWISFYLMLAPINIWLGNQSLTRFTSRGDWRPVIAIFLGALTCGFFWEMWNFFSFPKWAYSIPWGNFLHIFEMPLLGYGGYLPFGLELFALYHLVMGLIGNKSVDYVTDGLSNSS